MPAFRSRPHRLVRFLHRDISWCVALNSCLVNSGWSVEGRGLLLHTLYLVLGLKAWENQSPSWSGPDRPDLAVDFEAKFRSCKLMFLPG